jgi:hypothetical protein
VGLPPAATSRADGRTGRHHSRRRDDRRFDRCRAGARDESSTRLLPAHLGVREPGGGQVAESAAWFYPEPSPGYEALVGRVAVYPGRMDSCEVDGETVLPQAGGFYGGWITDRVVGPFKGEPGTMGW